MSSTNGNGGYSQVSDIEHVTRREYIDLEEKVDALLDDHRILDGKLTGLTTKSTSHSAAIATVHSVVKEHSELLGRISTAVINIEASLKLTAEKADAAEKTAQRASWTNEVVTDLAKSKVEEDKLELLEKKNSIDARAERQKVFVGAFNGAFAGAGAALKEAGKYAIGPVCLIAIAVLARACDVPVPGLP